jgi:hypothetical protein
VAHDAEIQRAKKAADEARHQQTVQDMQAKLVKADTDEEKFRKEYGSEIQQQHPDKVMWACPRPSMPPGASGDGRQGWFDRVSMRKPWLL